MNIKNLLVQGIALFAVLGSVFFILSQVNWISLLDIEKKADNTEKKLGELFLEIFTKTEKEIQDTCVINSVDSILNRICMDNRIDRKRLKLHIINKEEVNAFALPDGHLVLYSGLIMEVDSPEELSGVLCHEIAHVELNHVMKKLVKEVGLSVLVSMTTGSSGSKTVQETAKMLSGSAYDRRLESEADKKAVDYLLKANIDPEALANFLYKISDVGNEFSNYLAWISTHPDSKERAGEIISLCRNKSLNFKPVLAQKTWSELKERIKVDKSKE